MKSSALKACLLGGGFVAALLVGEAVLRLFNPDVLGVFRNVGRMDSDRGKFCVYDHELGWVGRPDAAGEFEWRDCRAMVRQNSRGFRGSDIGFERTGRERWVIMGDSFVWGFGVEEKDVFTSRLEERSKGRLEVVNLGVSGYGPDQELLLWRRLGRHWKPDVLLVFVTMSNDPWDAAAEERYGYPKPRFVLHGDSWRLENVPVPRLAGDWYLAEDPPAAAGGDPFWKRSAWAALVTSAAAGTGRGRDFLERRGVIPQRQAGWEGGPDNYQKPWTPALEKGWDALTFSLTTLAREAQEAGVRVIFVPVPAALEIDPVLWERFSAAAAPEKREKMSPGFPAEEFSRIARRNGLDVLDVYPAFRAAHRSGASLYFPLNGHWSPSGHRVASDFLWRALLKEDLR